MFGNLFISLKQLHVAVGDNFCIISSIFVGIGEVTVQAMKAQGGVKFWCHSFLKHSTGWRRVGVCKPLEIYTRGINLRYPFNGSLAGFQNQS
jgi:hypothetical protein